MTTPTTYDPVADVYAERIDTAPYNALFERPAMLALLPEVAEARVLDAGCGPGWYTEQLIGRGARVTAIDQSAVMVGHARRRVGDAAEVRVADLAQPLDFADDASYDGIISGLVLEHVRDWGPMFAEFHRILRPGGWLLFSAQHPFSVAARRQLERYVDVVTVQEEWSLLGGMAPAFHHRPVSAMVNALADAGFVIERLEEPLPLDEFRALRPDDYARMLRRPGFILFLARRP
jgi:SAM-dependent methyltransferase